MKLYNTMTRAVEDFRPATDNTVKMYTCGLTVYSQPHIGNWVAYIYWDILVRVLKADGYDVNRVQNITDVGHLTSNEDGGEDKMLASALKEGTTAWDVAEKYMVLADEEAFTKLGLIRPDHMPRATDYIQQQIEFIRGLEEKGYTYVIEDGVYFDTSKLSDYGKLARLDIAGLQFGSRVADTGKKNPTDFALWKLSLKDQKRDMEWDSPWGKGFPGWHLECSVMARQLLGDTIDIHTGGIDHIPVHHTNEIAQTESLTGKPFANIWVHANHIKVNGTKMSKSLGNIFTLDDIKQRGLSLNAFKLMILSKHYRTEGNFTWEILEAAQNRLQRWQNTALLRFQTLDSGPKDSCSPEILDSAAREIIDSLKNDLLTPAAIMAIDQTFNQVTNGILEISKNSFINLLNIVRDLLGIDLLSGDDITNEQKQLLDARQQTRDNQEWDRSNQLREELKSQGIHVRDTPYGQIWERN
ncbi:cysteine--tRNA ligase [Candidatus Saccharibacteria bacterium]|nr:cysteine--tRNA ligase [Candidatus Saccharibacteria bacterium]